MLSSKNDLCFVTETVIKTNTKPDGHTKHMLLKYTTMKKKEKDFYLPYFEK